MTPLPADARAIVASWFESGPEPEARPEALNDPWHTAIHEAGYAVIGRKLGLDMGQASARADDDSAGHSLVGDPWMTLDRWWTKAGRPNREFRSVVRARVLMLMAGAEAERIILGSLQDIDGAHGDEGDRHEVDLVMEHHPGDLRGDPARLASLRRAAGRLVRRHWHAIEAVAAELHARGTVPGAELDAMVPGPPPGPVDPMWEALVAAEPEGAPVRSVRLRRGTFSNSSSSRTPRFDTC